MSHEKTEDSAMQDPNKQALILLEALKNDPNLMQNSGQYLEWAAENGQLNVVQYLVEKGVNINPQGGESPPLYAATENNQLNVVQYLVEQGAKINSVGGIYDKTPLQCAAKKQNLQLFRTLLRTNADIYQDAEHAVFTQGRHYIFQDLARSAIMLSMLETEFTQARKLVLHPSSQATQLKNKIELVNALIEGDVDRYSKRGDVRVLDDTDVLKKERSSLMQDVFAYCNSDPWGVSFYKRQKVKPMTRRLKLATKCLEMLRNGTIQLQDRDQLFADIKKILHNAHKYGCDQKDISSFEKAALPLVNDAQDLYGNKNLKDRLDEARQNCSDHPVRGQRLPPMQQGTEIQHKPGPHMQPKK